MRHLPPEYDKYLDDFGQNLSRYGMEPLTPKEIPNILRAYKIGWMHKTIHAETACRPNLLWKFIEGVFFGIGFIVSMIKIVELINLLWLN